MWKIKLSFYFENEFLGVMCEKVEIGVIDVFVKNLKDLLMVVFVGLCIILGFDFGLCIGCKIVVVDSIGKFLIM